MNIGGNLALVCPHGSKGPCSQCPQPDGKIVKPRIITRDETTGQMLADGVPVRDSQPKTEWKPPNTGRKYTNRREKTCTICGKQGHTRSQHGK